MPFFSIVCPHSLKITSTQKPENMAEIDEIRQKYAISASNRGETKQV
jgi:hypothetical protein